MSSIRHLLLLSLLGAACGGKLTPAAQPPANDGTGAAETAALGGAASLGPGDATLGCFAWSTRTHAAACITGERSWTTTELQLAWVGGDAPDVALGESIDDATAESASAALARDGFALLVGTATAVVPGTPTDAGGVSLAWDTKETDAGGDNVAPTHRNVVTARCGGAALPLFELEQEGRDVEVRFRALPGHLLVEIAIAIALEGEYGKALEARVIDTASCQVAASP